MNVFNRLDGLHKCYKKKKREGGAMAHKGKMKG